MKNLKIKKYTLMQCLVVRSFGIILKTSKILRIWRHFQELAKFMEKFLEQPPIDSCFPNTKSKFWQSSEKNFSNDLLSTHVLLIQSGKIGQKFHSSKNFDNSKNLTSFLRSAEILGKILRTTSYQVMFSWYKVEFSRKIFFLQPFLGIWRHFQEF